MSLEKPHFTRPMKNLNKKVYWFGLAPLQAITIAFCVLICSVISIFISIFLAVVVYFLFAKAKKENGNGNPDFIGGYFTFIGYHKVYEDTTCYISNLKKNG